MLILSGSIGGHYGHSLLGTSIRGWMNWLSGYPQFGTSACRSELPGKGSTPVRCRMLIQRPESGSRRTGAAPGRERHGAAWVVPEGEAGSAPVQIDYEMPGAGRPRPVSGHVTRLALSAATKPAPTISSAASSGLNVIPHGESSPAATGSATTL